MSILHSIYGRLIGTDNSGHVVIRNGFRALAQTTATLLTTATAITNYGHTTFTTTAATAKGYSLDDPTSVGLYKTLSQASSSTAGLAITTASSASCKLDGINNTVTLKGAGNAVQLVSLSTASWNVVATSGANIAFSTA